MPNQHNSGRVVKFSKDGRFIKTWGHKGAAPGDFDEPHDIFIGGSQGRVCRRPQEQPGPGLRSGWQLHRRMEAIWSAELGVCCKDDTLYVGDHIRFGSQARLFEGHHGRERQGRLAQGLHSGPRPRQVDVGPYSGASGIAADAQGTIYAADVGPHRLRKYVLK